MEVVLFHRQRKNLLAAQGKSAKDLVPMVSAVTFLAESKRTSLVKKIREYSGLEDASYDSLCSTLITNLVEYCQNLPETANSYYSQPGGLVDHALNRTEAALGLFKEFTLQEQPHVLSGEQKLWQYALFSAAILQGIAKLFVDLQIHVFDVNGQLLKQWNPLIERLTNAGAYFSYEFQKEPEIEFRRRLNVLLARILMPESGFHWIASNPTVLAVWLALLHEDQRSSGTLGAILIRADAIALQRYFFEHASRNTLGRGGALGRSGTFSGGTPETIAEKDLAIGTRFIQWIQSSLEKGLIQINKAPLWMVPGGMLMCQEMYQLFIREHPEFKNWQTIQKAFLSLGLHQRTPDGRVNGRFEQASTHEMMTGEVLVDYAVALPDSVTVHHTHDGTLESMSAIEFVHQTQENYQFTQQVQHHAVAPLQQLSATGWVNQEPQAPSAHMGINHSV